MGKIHHSSLKACSHSCARHNFFPTRDLAVVVKNKLYHSWLRHSWCNLFFPPRLLSHLWGKICDLHRNGNIPFVTHGVFSIHSLGASPLVSVFSHPYFSSVGDWLNPRSLYVPLFKCLTSVQDHLASDKTSLRR